MSKYKEVVYLCLDELKLHSDDSEILEEHLIFLANKYRALLLKLKYSDIKKEIPASNYQTLCLELEVIPPIVGEPCEGGQYLRSKNKVPTRIPIGNPIVSTLDYYLGNITLIDKERMRYVGYNKFLKDIIYCSQGPDNYLYLKSINPQFLHLEKIKYTAIFEDAEQAVQLDCDTTTDGKCDILEAEFPLEESFIPELIQLIIKDILGATYRPSDSMNNANDDLSDLMSYIRRNTKSGLLKQLEE